MQFHFKNVIDLDSNSRSENEKEDPKEDQKEDPG
jgi:hypothetical protein